MKIVVLSNIQPGKLVVAIPGGKEVVIQSRGQAELLFSHIAESFFQPANTEAQPFERGREEQILLHKKIFKIFSKVGETRPNMDEAVTNPAWNLD